MLSTAAASGYLHHLHKPPSMHSVWKTVWNLSVVSMLIYDLAGIAFECTWTFFSVYDIKAELDFRKLRLSRLPKSNLALPSGPGFLQAVGSSVYGQQMMRVAVSFMCLSLGKQTCPVGPAVTVWIIALWLLQFKRTNEMPEPADAGFG